MEIIQNLPFADYLARPGLNASLLKIVHRECLAKAKAHMDGLYKKESAALDFGRCFHAYALEGREDFVIQPETYESDTGTKKWSGNANVCKAWKADQCERMIFGADEAETVYQMTKAVRSELGNLMDGQKELSLFAGRLDGVELKCRIDLLPHNPKAPIVDLKTALSAEPAKFLRSCLDLGYDMQAALTLDIAKLCGIERHEFWLVAIESDYPYSTGILKFTDGPLTFVEAGRIKYQRAIRRIINAKETGQWPAYGVSRAEDHATAWMIKEMETP